MTYKVSTGLRNAMLDTGSLRDQLDLGFLDIYSGPVPATADAAPDISCTKLCRASNNSTGTGLTMEAVAVAGSLSKESTETWSGVNLASGTATFYRHVGAADDATLSTTQPRVQGTIANSGAELNLTNTTLTSGAPQIIDYYNITLPTL
jgi:hypothetical protein